MAATEGDPDSPQPSQGRQLDAAALLLVLALTAAVRLPGITRPLLGNFATKQAVYGMIARNWALGRAEFAYPAIDVLRDGHRALQLVEMPVSAYATGAGWRLFGGSLDVWGRATAVAMSLGSVALLYLFVRRRHSRAAACGAAVALALSPVSIVYGQSFMLQASVVFFTVGAFFGLDRWLHGGGRPERRGNLLWLAAAAACLALLLLTKIYMAVVLLPLAERVRKAGAPRRQTLLALLAVGLALLPAVWWYAMAYQAAAPGGPLAERVFYSVRQSGEAHRPPHPLLFSPDFYRGRLDDLTGVVLTPLGFILALAGMLDRRWRRYGVWLAASALLILALPRKFHEMNYYWMAVLPPLCVLVGLGWQTVSLRMRPGRIALGAVLAVGLAFSLRYSLKPAFVTPTEDRGVPAAAAALQELAPSDDEPVVALHGTSLDLLYYCDRPGWAVAPQSDDLPKRLAACRRQGARLAVVVGADLAGLGEPVAKGDAYRIYRLGLENP